MDAHTFQENWISLYRKFPLVCAIDASSFSIEETKAAAASHCVQFDHVVILTNGIMKSDLKEFCSSERIINLSCFRFEDIPGKSFDEKISSSLSGQMILVHSKVMKVPSDVRWRLYDKVKEMKSPLTNVISLDSQFRYCTEEHAVFIARLRMK